MIMKVEERRGTRNESHTLSSKKEPVSIEDLMPNTGMGLERRKKYLLSGIQSRNDYEDRQRERERGRNLRFSRRYSTRPLFISKR